MPLHQGSDWPGDDLPLREGDAVLTVAEGGDHVLRMLSARPRRIAVVERHREQLHLLDLKLAAVKSLDHGGYLELVGQAPSRRRRALFQQVRWRLTAEADAYWLRHLAAIDRGVATQGVLERRLASFRTFVRLVHGPGKVVRYLALRNEAERRSMLAGEWQTFLWRKFGPWVWRRWFAVPIDRLERLLLDGRLLSDPPALTAAEFEAAKALANRVLLVGGSPEDYLRALPSGSIDAFALGRMDLAGLDEEFARVAAPGARFARIATPGDPAEADLLTGTLVAGSFPL